ncbi:acetolactate synthase small subunit [Candidatus Bipolaricaulota bacterium]|jgi:acetolactate synthase-1/3 small subunit|nr:acetolactate synthase small subunit [Candidatus Bipolaricaulota bacterium]TFH07546.1 MAG: acetolactate synthase small subunit [Candidatus Atribacteria bacterium]
MDRTLIATVADRPGVLNRVASLFRRRAFNIESLTVGHTEREGISRMTIVVDGRRTDSTKVAQNLEKLVDVLEVEDITDRPAILHDLALIKVRVQNRVARSEILRITDSFQARLVDMCPQTAIVEIVGSEQKIRTVVEALRSHGILEMVRTGRVAMVRGESENGNDAPSTDGLSTSEWEQGGSSWQE